MRRGRFKRRQHRINAQAQIAAICLDWSLSTGADDCVLVLGLIAWLCKAEVHPYGSA